MNRAQILGKSKNIRANILLEKYSCKYPVAEPVIKFFLYISLVFFATQDMFRCNCSICRKMWWNNSADDVDGAVEKAKKKHQSVTLLTLLNFLLSNFLLTAARWNRAQIVNEWTDEANSDLCPKKNWIVWRCWCGLNETVTLAYVSLRRQCGEGYFHDINFDNPEIPWK